MVELKSSFLNPAAVLGLGMDSSFFRCPPAVLGLLSGELLPSWRLPMGSRDPAGIFEGEASLGSALLLRE
jgi:hypothetical protein